MGKNWEGGVILPSGNPDLWALDLGLVHKAAGGLTLDDTHFKLNIKMTSRHYTLENKSCGKFIHFSLFINIFELKDKKKLMKDKPTYCRYEFLKYISLEVGTDVGGAVNPAVGPGVLISSLPATIDMKLNLKKVSQLLTKLKESIPGKRKCTGKNAKKGREAVNQEL